MAAMHQPIFDVRDHDVADRAPEQVQREPPDYASSAARLARLVRTIEGEVIPRLVLAHRNIEQHPLVFGIRVKLPSIEDVAEFAALAVDHDASFLTAHVQKLRANGMPIESIYIDLLAPSARHLGQMWDDDLCDFTTVTMALWRLQQVLRNLGSSFHKDAAASGEDHRALLASMPGEQHTFGLFMVAEFFRRAGWEVVDSPMQSCEELLELIKREKFALAGLSAARLAVLDELTSLIAEMRLASRNRGIKILVGGPAFIERPDFFKRVGADAMARDGREAVALAQDMLSIPLRSC